MKKKGILDRLKDGPVLGDGGYLLELEKRGWVRAGPFTPEVALVYPDALRELHIEFRSSKGRKNQGSLSGDQMRAIKLRRDVRSKATASNGMCGVGGIRSIRYKITADSKKNLQVPIVHGVKCLNCI